jgi:peptidoglycan/xylan/chitin deacetylase (PgdA/CDA1 family)
MRYITSTPWWLRAVFPAGLVWRQKPALGTVYLTFDDGPHPEITPWVCSLLEAGGHKATFFCIGQNVVRYPEVFEQVKAGGHSIGNHTHHHQHGWKVPASAYVDNVKLANQYIGATLFRPPYGAIKSSQAKMLKGLGYSIVMWSGLSADFDVKITGEQAAATSIKHCKPGNILVFHDSEKAFPRLKTALPQLLNYMQAQGITSKGL